MIFLSLAEGGEIIAAGLVLVGPFTGEGSGLNIGKDLLHRRASLVAYNLRSASQVAILGSVGNRIAHAIQAALINEINDELHLMDALEVRNLRLITFLHQRVETALHHRGRSAAKAG